MLTYFCVNYSFHNKLKTNPRYPNHHVNKHCDDLIEVLLATKLTYSMIG